MGNLLINGYVNQTTLCGPDNFRVWDEEKTDFGSCFIHLCIAAPVQAMLAIVSAFYIGQYTSQWSSRSSGQKRLLILRGICCVLLAFLPIVRFTALLLLDRSAVKDVDVSFIIPVTVPFLAWIVHLLYTRSLTVQIPGSLRGPRPVLVAWFFCLVAAFIECRNDILGSLRLACPQDTVIFTTAIIIAVIHGVYTISMLPSGEETRSQYEELSSAQERRESSEPLLGRSSLTGSGYYNRFSEEADPHYLGVAKDRANPLNRLFFLWVNPLIAKGQRSSHGLTCPDDLFDLPDELTVHTSSKRFLHYWEEAEKLIPIPPLPATDGSAVDHRTRVRLLRLLYSCFGREFLCIGVLKFVQDCAGFAGPILLNLVVEFMETPSESILRGYIFAALLTFCTFFAAMASCHFNLLMNELGIKVRAAITTAVYRKTVSVSNANLSRFSTGQIINFMSTDTDRIVNLSPSVHAVWSLPFQFFVTLVLLYQQVGVSFLVGLAFTILVVPVNKVIANWIGRLSEKMMKAKDERVSLMSELLAGIRVIKYFNWQTFFTNRINTKRKEELKYLAGRKYLDALCVYLWATTPVLISVLTFVTYVLLGNQLTAAKVFTSVALFAMLTGPLNAFPWVLNGLIEALVSIRRLEDFFGLADFSREEFYTRMYDIVQPHQENHASIVVDGATFRHSCTEQTSTFYLDKITFTITRGDLVGVVGAVGSGKSSLLAALLGELEKVDGRVALDRPPQGVGYVHQEPWLQDGTVRDNILFGMVYQHTWYSRVVEACALSEDFRQLSLGDLTHVGEGGSKLSGGQRARVSLARAVYQNKELYLIDDIFSAVDGVVAEHIHRKCMGGLLAKRTRVLCTHQTRFLSQANLVLCLEEGRIKEVGPPEVVLPRLSSSQMALTTAAANTDSLPASPPGATGISGRTSPGTVLNTSPESQQNNSADNSNEETKVESQETGRVKWRIYHNYWVAVGRMLSVGILVSLVAMQATRNLTDVWLAHWVTQAQQNQTQPNTSHPTRLFRDDHEHLYGGDFNVKFYLSVYAMIAGSNSFFSLLRAFLFAYGGMSAAAAVHAKLLRAVMRARIAFFDNTPTGRILNRFSSDLYTVDDSLPFILNIFLANLFGVIGPIIVTAYSLPYIIGLLLPLSYIYFRIQRQYRPASRQLKRIGSVALSPIYAHFSETLAGVSTIRALENVGRFARDNEARLESSLKATYAGQAAGQWLELRLQLIGCCVVGGVAIIAVVQHHVSGADPGMVGLAISYALGITGRLSGLVSSFTETERELVAIERCTQYIDNIKPENIKGTLTSPYRWPSEGVITFKNVVMRYQAHLPYALRGVSFQTRSCEKLGIVGRTGSGKSSIFQALYRLVEIESGEICIDNVNIRHLDLEELREQLVIIPQNPFLFSGTVKENLDPCGFCTDRQLLEALRKAKLDKLVTRLGGLTAQVEDGGQAFSAGQRQLLCLARAILSPARIILVDEATANVDAATDIQVQKVIQSCLADRTVLTVAHRVDTVLGCDRVMVMEDGNIVETGHPNILLRDNSARFSRLMASQ